MKRKLKIMLCVFLGLSLFGCSNTNGATQSNKTDNKAEKENIKKATSKKNTSGIEDIDLGTFKKIKTKHGEFEIAFYGAVETDWDKNGYEDDLQDSDETTYPVSIRVGIANISYSGLTDDSLCGYDLSEDGSIVVKDSKGFSLNYYDIAGPEDGEFVTDVDIPTGEKMKVSLPYTISNDESSLTIIIGKKYRVKMEVERI